jgi:signal transduction histidine kinase
MGDMRIFLILLRRILGRLLRRLGWGALLVPVAAMGLLVYGINLWTVAAVALAVILVARRPAAAAALLPVALVCAGIWGLAVAAATAGPGMANLVAMPAWTARLPFERVFAGKGAPRNWTMHPGGITVSVPRVPVPPPLPRNFAMPAKAMQHQVVINAKALHGNVTYVGGPGKAVYQAVIRGLARHGPPPVPPAGFVRSWLLVPVALLMLTVGLCLVPRSLARLRQRAGPLAPYLRHRVRELGWGLALVPAVAVGLSVFGPSPWMVTALIAAAIITVMWPEIAADLVPFVLIVLAIRGFALAASWRSLPAGVFGPGAHYGFVTVDGRQSALLAGAEASGLMAFAGWLVPRTIVAHLRSMFSHGPDADLAGRVQRLTETRGHAVDTAAAELRRIERDLHDGAQARLVALGMNLRAAERILPTSPQAALALVAEARETSVRALNELRGLIRGICPPVLADRGLGHAIHALVLDTPLPTTLDIDLPGRLSAPVESACYFAVAEALANAVKHSGARSAQIRIRYREGMLRIEVSDDGAGGADPAQGTGLAGVERRLGTFDGILAVNSPPGGPTMIAMEVPCALSSPKTCFS